MARESHRQESSPVLSVKRACYVDHENNTHLFMCWY